MFVITPSDQWEKGDTSVSDKCDPEYIFELREQFHSIYAGPMRVINIGIHLLSIEVSF
ncbi:hypothetical protein [Aestuariivivens sp. NBU2969]|uniref:hypothetical protein n=1 Tax=Aestuariivivens sp. NBU2969 TaxID=2873267 RepID=UPI00351D5156